MSVPTTILEIVTMHGMRHRYGCPGCRGAGTVPCQNCKGSGIHRTRYIFGLFRDRECRGCNGTGTLTCTVRPNL